MAENQQPTLLVTGASGHLGHRVVELLLASHAGTIIAASRTPEKLSDLAEKGAETRCADFDDPDSLAEAFAGVNRLLLISTDDLSTPGRRLKQHQTAVKSAQKAGVKHVLYTSLIDPVDNPVTFAPDHAGTEKALADSTMGWTVLRNAFYMDLLIGTLVNAYSAGALYAATGDGKCAYVTREDCAIAAAATLSSSFEGRRTLDITGPQALSQADIAAAGAEMTGKPLGYVPVELEAVIRGMIGAGLPRPLAETYASIGTGIAQGRFGKVSSDFEEVTGQKPTGLKAFLAANKDALLAAVGA